MADPELNDQSLAELLQRLSAQTSDLVRKEIRLAQVELQDKGKRAGIGGGLLGGAALIAVFAVGALVAGGVLALATALDAWLAALIVGVALLLVAGVSALLGKNQVRRAIPPAPEQAISSVQADIGTVKEKAGRA